MSSTAGSPFLAVTDAGGRSVGWSLVTAPITTRAHHAELRDLSAAGIRFAGMPGYLTFPRVRGDVRDYGALCEAWCHCFRDPDRYLPPGAPRALISYSDFTDYVRIRPDTVTPAADSSFDFLYVGATASWKRAAKNWRLAARCIPRLASELGLRAVVVGDPSPEFVAHPAVRFTRRLPWHEFLGLVRRARFLFVPNVDDASPRVLAEALCLDVPIVVNESILGGWKYVNPFTGVFFRGEDDVVSSVERCLARPRGPRGWFRANHGPYHAGIRLLRLLRTVDSSIAEPSHLRITEPDGVPSAHDS